MRLPLFKSICIALIIISTYTSCNQKKPRCNSRDHVEKLGLAKLRKEIVGSEEGYLKRGDFTVCDHSSSRFFERSDLLHDLDLRGPQDQWSELAIHRLIEFSQWCDENEILLYVVPIPLRIEVNALHFEPNLSKVRSVLPQRCKALSKMSGGHVKIIDVEPNFRKATLAGISMYFAEPENQHLSAQGAHSVAREISEKIPQKTKHVAIIGDSFVSKNGANANVVDFLKKEKPHLKIDDLSRPAGAPVMPLLYFNKVNSGYNPDVCFFVFCTNYLNFRESDEEMWIFARWKQPWKVLLTQDPDPLALGIVYAGVIVDSPDFPPPSTLEYPDLIAPLRVKLKNGTMVNIATPVFKDRKTLPGYGAKRGDKIQFIASKENLDTFASLSLSDQLDESYTPVSITRTLSKAQLPLKKVNK